MEKNTKPRERKTPAAFFAPSGGNSGASHETRRGRRGRLAGVAGKPLRSPANYFATGSKSPVILSINPSRSNGL